MIAVNLAYSNNQLCETLHCLYRDILNFDFLGKGLGIVSQLHFVYVFSRKVFLMLHSINRPNFIVWLPFLLEILDNIYVCQLFVKQGVMSWIIKLGFFLIKLFLYITKKSRQIFKACVYYFHQISIFSPNDSLSKTMKNNFYLI